jgi:hypothetical protein
VIWLLAALAALVLGVWLPWRLGFTFLDAAMLLLYGCLSAVWAAGGGVRKAGWGFAASQGLIALGLITVNVAGRHGALLLPPAGVWAGVAMVSLAAALAVAAAGIERRHVWMALAGGVIATQLAPGEWRGWWDAQLTPGRLARDGAILLALAAGYSGYRHLHPGP